MRGFLLILFLVGSAHGARPQNHGLCSRLLAEGPPPFLVYALDKKPFFSRQELRFLRELYDQGVPSPHRRTTVEGGGTTLDNPFLLMMNGKRVGREIEVDPFWVEVLGVRKSFFQDEMSPQVETLTDLLDRVVNRMYSIIEAAAVPTGYFEERRELKMFSFGIRYELLAGRRTGGVDFHQDGCRFQAMILLRRPRTMRGGSTGLRLTDTPSDQMSDGRQFSSQLPGRRLQLPVNRLLVFDGTNTQHKVSGFSMTRSEAQSPGVRFRDILGICFK